MLSTVKGCLERKINKMQGLKFNLVPAFSPTTLELQFSAPFRLDIKAFLIKTYTYLESFDLEFTHACLPN